MTKIPSPSFIPELLSPAGNLDKLKIAILYGANAVYLGGQNFGLRSAADNFTDEELQEGVDFAHDRGAKVYVVLNSFLHDKDLSELPIFLKFLEQIKVDAVIVSDLGVIKMVRSFTDIDIHLSTQASCLNLESAIFWKEQGVKRIVLAREVSIQDAGRIKKEAGVEVEMFIHGSMCMAYSGNCTISNYTRGRDSNRGGCAHSCRFEYSFSNKRNVNQEVVSNKEKLQAYFMSSKDLGGLKTLPYFIEEKIDSLKIEGRMKGPLYVGSLTKIYSEALQTLRSEFDQIPKRNSFDFFSNQFSQWEEELKKVPHRGYTTANLLEEAKEDSIFNQREVLAQDDYAFVGTVLAVEHDKFLLIDIRKGIKEHEKLELIPFQGQPKEIIVEQMRNILEEKVTQAKPNSLVKFPYVDGAEKWNILRKRELV